MPKTTTRIVIRLNGDATPIHLYSEEPQERVTEALESLVVGAPGANRIPVFEAGTQDRVWVRWLQVATYSTSVHVQETDDDAPSD
jgi:hypothetical protein